MNLSINTLKFIGEKDDFTVYFDPIHQTYSVYKDGKFLIGNKYKYSDIRSYLE